jgi:hypothetical protein
VTRFSPGHFYGRGMEPTPAVPWDPGTTVLEAPDQPNAQSEVWHVAIGPFPAEGPFVALWSARVDHLAIRNRESGGNACTVVCPADPVSMKIIGDALGTSKDQAGRQLYGVDGAVGWELLIGSNLNGKVRHRFVVRDIVEVADGMLSISGVGFIGGLTGDRVLGAPERKNLITPGSFDSGTLDGWSMVVLNADGSVASSTPCSGSSDSITGLSARVVPGGPDGTYYVKLKGTPDSRHFLERRAPYHQGEHPWGRQRIASTAYVSLPIGLDIDDYSLIATAVEVAGVNVWPGTGAKRKVDAERGLVTSDMVRGHFMPDAVTGVGFLPTPPFSCDICTRIYPLDPVKEVSFDGVELIRRENSTTETAVDLTKHIVKLFKAAQEPGVKSTWRVRAEAGPPHGELFGKSEVGTWWDEDGQSMNDAIEAVCGRGLEAWDAPGQGRVVAVAKRRGTKREDIQINPSDVLGVVKWQVDPGAMRTAARATSAANTIWHGSDEGYSDPSHANGQVIDITISGPVGMTPTQLRAWVRRQLASMKVAQTTTSVLLPWDLGMRLQVGDSVHLAMSSWSAGLSKWVGITAITPDLEGRFVMVDLGTEVT